MLLLQVSLLQLLLPVLHVQIRRHARGFACNLSLALPHLAINDSHPKIVVVHVTPPAIFPVTAAFQKSAHANDSPLATSLATDGDSLQGISPLQSDGDSLQGIPPLQGDGDSLQGIPLLQNDGDSLHGTLIHLSVSTHPVPRLVMVLLRPPSRSSPTRPSSPSREDKEADESSIPALVRAMIDFILKSFPDAQASPSHPSSRSSISLPMQALRTRRFPRDRSWRGAMLCLMPSLICNSDSPVASKMGRSAILSCLLSTDLRECPTRLLKERS